jgi:sugar lactone lactonase YvrE
MVYLPISFKTLPLLNDAVPTIVPAASSSSAFTLPLDAAPSPDGSTIYFTATSAQGPKVLRVAAAGGPVDTLTVGAPLRTPLGLALSSDGQTIYIADTDANSSGLLYSLPVAGGAGAPLPGSAFTAPRGIEVAQENGVDLLYFTGIDPSTGAPAVLVLPASGEPLGVIARGAPLVEPVGVAIAQDGTLYIADRAAGGNGLGSVFRIRGGQVERLATGFRAGNPAGVALTLDEKLLLVSTLDRRRDRSQVLVINLASGQQGIVTKVVEANMGSGGLHRAHAQTAMAWCGITSGTQGTVYRIDFQ